jgi:hypothetical protein
MLTDIQRSYVSFAGSNLLVLPSRIQKSFSLLLSQALGDAD